MYIHTHTFLTRRGVSLKCGDFRFRMLAYPTHKRPRRSQHPLFWAPMHSLVGFLTMSEAYDLATCSSESLLKFAPALTLSAELVLKLNVFSAQTVIVNKSITVLEDLYGALIPTGITTIKILSSNIPCDSSLPLDLPRLVLKNLRQFPEPTCRHLRASLLDDNRVEAFRNLRYLQFGDAFNSPIFFSFPPMLQELHFGDKFNSAIQRPLPEGLKVLKLGKMFDRSLPQLPDGLRELILTGHYNWRLPPALPTGLGRFQVSECYMQSEPLPLPPNLTWLHAKCLIFAKLPSNLSALPLETLIAHAEELPLVLPQTLTHLDFLCSDPSRVHLEALSGLHRLRHLCLGNKITTAIDHYLPPNLQTLVLRDLEIPITTPLPATLTKLDIEGNIHSLDIPLSSTLELRTLVLCSTLAPQLSLRHLSSLTELSLTCRDSLTLELPDSLQKLQTSGLDKPLTHLPRNLLELRLGDCFSQPLSAKLFATAPNLTSLELGFFFDEILEIHATRLQKVVISSKNSDFFPPIRWPATLTELRLPADAACLIPGSYLPNLRTLTIGSQPFDPPTYLDKKPS